MWAVRNLLYDTHPIMYRSEHVHKHSESPQPDLNRGPHSYQECALPAELRGQLIAPANRGNQVGGGGFEPP